MTLFNHIGYMVYENFELFELIPISLLNTTSIIQLSMNVQQHFVSSNFEIIA